MSAVLRSFGPVFGLLFALQFVSMGAMEMSGPFWPLHIAELSSPGGVFALAGIGVYVCPMLGISLTSTLWGRMGDRLGNRLMMVRALAGLAITQILISFAQDVWLILSIRFLQGACAGYMAPAQAFSIQITEGKHRGVLLAWLQVATNVGSLAGAFLGGLILDASSFGAINLTAGLICAVCAAVAAMTLPAPETNDPKPSDASPAELPHPAPILGLLTLMAVLLTARMVLQVPFSLYMLEVFLAPHWMTGLCYGLLALGFVIAAPLWANFFRERSLSFVTGWMIAIAAGCAAITMLAGAIHSTEWFAILYFIWGGLLGGTTPVLVSIISAATMSDRQGAALGTVQAWQQAASVAGIAIGAIVSQTFGLGAIFPLVTLLYAISLFAAVGLWLFVQSRLPIGDSL